MLPAASRRERGAPTCDCGLRRDERAHDSSAESRLRRRANREASRIRRAQRASRRRRRPILEPRRRLEGVRGNAPSVGSVGPLASLRPALQLFRGQDPARFVRGFRKGRLEISLVLARDAKLSRSGRFRLIPGAHAGSVDPSPPRRSHAEPDLRGVVGRHPSVSTARPGWTGRLRSLRLATIGRDDGSGRVLQRAHGVATRCPVDVWPRLLLESRLAECGGSSRSSGLRRWGTRSTAQSALSDATQERGLVRVVRQ